MPDSNIRVLRESTRALLVIALIFPLRHPAVADEPALALFRQNSEAIYALMAIHDQISNDITALHGNDPESANRLATAARTQMGISREEFDGLSSLSAQTLSELSELDAEADQYVRPFMENHELPDVARLKQFEAERRRILQKAALKIEQVLSEASLAGLSRYVQSDLHLAGPRPAGVSR